ncbi:hypothetical protein NUW54_g7976 [Trametes sanguinea]|uniref:Uncharacterized protein n=1 Tax=Trametes sanguinea TaxID=158606 RepID=A0ACC1PGN3_9APHY|nr:hypothetical protein NUW54_g7976 [Trametes sanguinea]
MHEKVLRERKAGSNHLAKDVKDPNGAPSVSVKTAVAHGVSGQFAPIDIGVICDVAAVKVVGRMLHAKVFDKLESRANSKS